jgi:uncharacterized protein YndB with AHSA1/START domain
MPRATITSDQDAIVSEIDIAAPPERVFKALSDAAEVRRRSPELSVYEMEPRLGGRWRLEMHPPQPYQGFSIIRHDGEIVEFDPPHILAYTWTANFHKDPKMRSLVRWELTATNSGTHVKLTHSGLKLEPEARTDYAGGWPGVLDQLKNSLQK